ncbi:MAG: hypothetical protein H0T13_06895 [Actinobacteria bacterium]|nr:hypothetical protein [Actinomycetota bacterium]
MSRIFALARLPLVATAAFVVVLALLPGRRELALHLYALTVAALALAWLVGVVRRAHPVAKLSPFDLGLRTSRHTREPVAELERIEREVSMSASTAFDVHFRLRPRVQRIARQLLAARRGIDIATQPEAARRVLGEETWAIVRPDAQPPADRSGPGLDARRMRAVVASLEAL